MPSVSKILDIGYAVRLYYSRIELDSKDIGALFNLKSNTSIHRKKEEARRLMSEKKVPSCGLYTVNTAVAYEAWGLDIKDLEKRLIKLERYGGL